MGKERLENLDTLRGLAAVFMVLVHIQNIYGNWELPGETGRIVIDFLGGPPAAPVFMMIMGWDFCFP